MARIFQTTQAISRISNFFQVGNGQALSCSNVSAAVAFSTLPTDSSATDVLLYNAGAVSVFVAFSTATLTAAIPVNGTPANGFIIPAGMMVTLCKGSATYIAAVTASSTATLYFYQGYGS